MTQVTDFAAHVINTNTGLTGFDETGPPTSTPEPATVLLLGSGLLGIAGISRTRMSRS